MTLIKVCGLTSLKDAKTCIELGADMLGFVFAPSPRIADPETVLNIRTELGCNIKMVGVFTQENNYVLEIVKNCKLDFVQLHGEQSEAFAKQIEKDKIIRVVRIKDKTSLDIINSYKHYKYLLLDTYKKEAAGGTGEVFNWELAKLIKDAGYEYFLSGGLTPDNIRDAIRIVHPFGVDTASGVEISPGIKDIKRLKEFIDNVKSTN